MYFKSISVSAVLETWLALYPEWKLLCPLPEKRASLGIMEDYIRPSMRWCCDGPGGFRGALNWYPMMSRDLDSYMSDRCLFFLAKLFICLKYDKTLAAIKFGELCRDASCLS